MPGLVSGHYPGTFTLAAVAVRVREKAMRMEANHFLLAGACICFALVAQAFQLEKY
jgi:hypothetical protein